MKNWSGNQKWSPEIILYPTSEEEIKEIIQKAREDDKQIRTIGSSHSFTPLNVTDSVLLSLDRLQGLASVDHEQQQVTVRSGTKLYIINELLAEEGLALENMGDINVQSEAGALSTGNHGIRIRMRHQSTLKRLLQLSS